MARAKKKDMLIPVPTEVKERPESKVEKAIMKAKKVKLEPVIEDTESEDDVEYVIERLNNNFVQPPVQEPVKVQQPVQPPIQEPIQEPVQEPVKVQQPVQETPVKVKKPRAKKVKPVKEEQPVQPVQQVAPEYLQSFKKIEVDLKTSIDMLKKENEMLKKLGSYNDHLSRLSNMSRSMKIKF